MTIAKRLIVLLTVPLVALLGLGVFSHLQLAEIEERSRFVAESRITALATLGNLSRGFSEMRVNVRSYLLATTDVQRRAARAAFDDDEQDVVRLLATYADILEDESLEALADSDVFWDEVVGIEPDGTEDVFDTAEGTWSPNWRLYRAHSR